MSEYAPTNREREPGWLRHLGGAVLVVAGLSYLVNTWQHSRILWDDAYITFRYAQHLAQGRGLCWNVGGEPVEGYTSLLQVLLLAGAMRAGFTPETASLVVAVASLVGTAALVLLALRLTVGCLHPVAMVPLAIYLADPATAIHTTSGLETQLFVFLVCAGYVTGLFFVRRPGLPVALTMAVCVFLSVLCRPEGVLFGAGVFGILSVYSYACRRRGTYPRSAMPALLTAVGLILLLGITYAALKYRYFGYLLPNPYYVKSHRISMVGLPVVLRFFKHAVFWLGPLTGGILLLSPIGTMISRLRSGRARALVLLTLASPVLAWTYYSTITHEVGGAHRFSYPTYVYLIVATGVFATIAIRAMPPRRGRLVSAAISVAACAILLVATGRGPWSLSTLPRPPIAEYHYRIARALQETGLGSRGTVICVAAGVIPYMSGFNHVDPVGLTDNYLSGRRPATARQRESYLWSRNADVYVGFEPPASAGSTSPSDDSRMQTPYVVNNLLGRRLHLIENRFHLQDPRLLYKRMTELRDNWHWVGEIDWAGWEYWKLKSFIYVRKRSPHVRILLPALESIVDVRPGEIELAPSE